MSEINIPNRNNAAISRTEVHARADYKKILGKELKENGVYWVAKEGKEPADREGNSCIHIHILVVYV